MRRQAVEEQIARQKAMEAMMQLEWFEHGLIILEIILTFMSYLTIEMIFLH